MVDASTSASLWRSVRSMPEFWRLLELRTASQFGDGLFQAGLAGGLLFNPERAADPWAKALLKRGVDRCVNGEARTIDGLRIILLFQ